MKLDLNGAPVAALLTPRTPMGEVDYTAFEGNVALAMERGVSGICIGGATGEYALAAPEERRRLLEAAHRLTSGHVLLIAAIGGATMSESIALGRHAALLGADAALLPPPYFFPYAQDDVEAFYREAAREIPLPILIYNLPSFTTGVETETVLRLVESVPNIIGIKDSSGRLDTLRALSADACRLVGHDAVLGAAIESGCCDSAISGVAGVLPELTVGIFNPQQREVWLRRSEELLPRLDCLPTPWGLKLIAECRGLFKARFPLPVSDRRRTQMESFKEWSKGWWQA